MRPSHRLVALATVALLVPACTTFEVEGDGSLTERSVRGSETVHGSFWGIDWAERPVQKCESTGLYRVQYHTNVAYLLASVGTLGLWVPQSVEWWCSTPAQEDTPDEFLLTPESEGR